jgi:NAD(P)-dependent dehydrogenase (short-subunit alcohol dehydrogenase family)
VFEKNLLAGKRILVTGGATGLGKSMGKRFLELGASLYICGRREEVLAEAADELRKTTGGTIKTFSCDVRDNQRVNAMIDTIWQDGPLDALINNAAGNFLCRTEELSIGAFEAVIGIVLMGTLHCTMACGKRWIKEKHKASVLSITTTYAQWGSPYVVPSSVAKAGVLNMTRSLAVEWGKYGIRFNAIAPGPVPTEGAFSRLMPVKSLEEIAKKKNPIRLRERRTNRYGRRRAAQGRERIRAHGRYADGRAVANDEAEEERLGVAQRTKTQYQSRVFSYVSSSAHKIHAQLKNLKKCAQDCNMPERFHPVSLAE